MTLTAQQVQDDIYALLRQDGLGSLIGGNVYHGGDRPRDSKAEDAVIVFTAGAPGEIEAGTVTVLVYIPDIDPWGDGTLRQDRARAKQVQRLLADWAAGLTCDRGDYRFTVAATPQTYEAEQAGQHFVSLRLDYRHFDTED